MVLFRVPSWWSNCEESGLLLRLCLWVLIIRSAWCIVGNIVALQSYRFRGAVCFCVTILFNSAEIAVSAQYIYAFQMSTVLTESGVLLSLRPDVHALVADVGSFPVLQVFQFDYWNAYFAYYRTCIVDWKDEAFVRWLPHINWSGGALDTFAWMTNTVGERPVICNNNIGPCLCP